MCVAPRVQCSYRRIEIWQRLTENKFLWLRCLAKLDTTAVGMATISGSCLLEKPHPSAIVRSLTATPIEARVTPQSDPPLILDTWFLGVLIAAHVVIVTNWMGTWSIVYFAILWDGKLLHHCVYVGTWRMRFKICSVSTLSMSTQLMYSYAAVSPRSPLVSQ